MSSLVDQILKVANQYYDAFPVNPAKVKKQIIDDYNKYKPQHEYTMTLNDPWCAAFVGAVAGRCGAGDIIPISASCSRMISFFRGASRWKSYTTNPPPGSIIFYDWDKDCTPDHVGIVESVIGNRVCIIEGNMSGKVGKRLIAADYTLIEGYGIPEYSKPCSINPAETVIIPSNDYETLSAIDRRLVNQMPVLLVGSRNVYVTILQTLLVMVGDYNLEIDGDFGENTRSAVMDFQKTCALEMDGIVGVYTWSALLV